MTCMRCSMLLLSVLKLLLGCTAGLTRAAHLASPGTLMETTTIPNHLREDDTHFRFSLVTSSVTITTRGFRTIDKTNQLEPFWSTPSTAPLTKKMAPTVKPTGVTGNSTLASKRNTTLNFSVSDVKHTTLPASQSDNSSWTVTSASQPLASTTEKGPVCNCSSEGSRDPDACDRVTGNCTCLTGYAGHHCDECDDAYFNNGTNVCQTCDCNSTGALNQLCNGSGVCTCKSGVSGEKCSDCRPGFTGFSSAGCQPCQCNNHSSYCHPQSGTCVDCQGNTEGPGCQKCRYNFYRRPGSSVADPCVPCPCSSVTSTGSCLLDWSGQPVCVQCKPEYQGPNCEQCSHGFYNADSICLPCNCSGNADPRTSPGICHPDTGHCLSCIHNTTGLNCEQCAEGFTGHALDGNCTPAVVHTSPPPPPTTVQSFQVSTTMTSSPLLTSLTTSVPNTTTTALPWNQFNIIVLSVIIMMVVALILLVGGVYTYREYQNRKLSAPFWTIELKEDNISFSSYHDCIPNADISGLLEDDMSDLSNGQLALTGPGGVYKV